MFEKIDKSRLSRDYSTNPLKKGELINESDLRYLFEELNYSRDEIGLYFGFSATPIRRALKKYGIKKSPELYLKKSIKTCLDKYGVQNPLQDNSFREQIEKTNILKYGTKNPFSVKSVQDKIHNTNIKKYGHKNPQSCEHIKRKSIDTLKRKYGIYSGIQLHINNKDIWFDNLKLSEFIIQGNNGAKWRTVDLAEYFNIANSTVQVKVGELDLWNYIDTNSSKYETEIVNLLNSWGLNTYKYRKNGLEIDIFLEGLNIGIEFNGNYWHSTRIRTDYNYHKSKSDLASSLGIFLYHIFEYEWINKKEQVINQLKNILKLNKETIFARKCILKEVDLLESKDFLNSNHIQGNSSSKVKLGLYYNNELVSLMTFGKSRFNKKTEWELVRFCSKAGTNVVGGASKLFKHFIKEYKPKSIVSYSDITKTKGGLYKLLGFNTVGTSAPNYVWVYGNKVLTRYQCQKKQLISNGWGTSEQTEKEIMESHNFSQIFDCGNRTHIWNSVEVNNEEEFNSR